MELVCGGVSSVGASAMSPPCDYTFPKCRAWDLMSATTSLPRRWVFLINFLTCVSGASSRYSAYANNFSRTWAEDRHMRL